MISDKGKEMIKYMKQRYEETLFPFFKLVDIYNRFGKEVRDDLNVLARKKIVAKREGINSPLIEITTYGIGVLKKIKY